MKKTIFCIFFLLINISIFASVEKSIIPLMNDSSLLLNIEGKINSLQKREIAECQNDSCPIRLMSFNMLFNIPKYENKLDPENRWPLRKERQIEYLLFANADIVATQELQQDQIDALMEGGLNDVYNYYGTNLTQGKGDIQAIFYKKDRFLLLDGKTYPYLDCGDSFVFCRFKDMYSGREFIVVNVHFAFSNIEKRYIQACLLSQIFASFPKDMPAILTGDFNTFPFLSELALPFYDGDKLISLIEEGGLKDSKKISSLGHLGPISSTNFCSKEQKSFCNEGNPGVILDHIFVNDAIKVRIHGIDAARVDGYFPSDHFPVIVDLCL